MRFESRLMILVAVPTTCVILCTTLLLVAPPRLFASCIGGVRSAEFLTPLSDRFVGNFDTALGQKIFDIAQAQREAIVEPHGIADDLRGKSISSIVGRLAEHRRSLPITASS